MLGSGLLTRTGNNRGEIWSQFAFFLPGYWATGASGAGRQRPRRLDQPRIDLQVLLVVVVATTVGFPMTIVLHPEASTRGIKMMNYKLVGGVETTVAGGQQQKT